MKTTKLLSLLLALCMIVSVISIGVVASSAAEVKEEYSALAADPEDPPAADVEEGSDDETDTLTPGEGDGDSEGDDTADTIDSLDPFWASISANGVLDVTDDEYLKLQTLAVDHYSDSGDFFFYPMTCFASQPVSNGSVDLYLFLTGYSDERIERDTEGMSVDEILLYHTRDRWLTIFTIFTDNYGNQEIMKAAPLNPETVKTLEEAPETLDDPWILFEKHEDTSDAAVFNALEAYDGMKLSYLADVGKLFLGNQRRLLCYGTGNSGDPKTALYIVDITEDYENNTAEVTRVAFFDLFEYVPTQAEIEEFVNGYTIPTSTTITSTSTATSTGSSGGKTDSGSSSGSSSSGANTSSKSPNTGVPNVVVFVMMIALIAFLGSCVSVKQIVKKHD